MILCRHHLQHTNINNLKSNDTAPTYMQKLFGLSDVHIVLNVYTHITREANRLPQSSWVM